MAQESKVTDTQMLRFAMDRIAVLEQIVSGLAKNAGAYPPQIDNWTNHIANWPDVESSFNSGSSHVC